jgi:hypothetical protein
MNPGQAGTGFEGDVGREIVYCDLCGERVLEIDFEKGRAYTAGNKNYCPKCADKGPPRPPPPPSSSSNKSSGLHKAQPQDTPRRITRSGSGKTSAMLPSIRAEIPGKKSTTRKYDTQGRPVRDPQTPSSLPKRLASLPPIVLIGIGVFAALALLVIIIVVVSRGQAGRRTGAPPPVQTGRNA